MRLTALFACAAVLLATGAQAKTVAVRAERLVDVASGKVTEKPLVIITDGRITAVGKQGDATPAGAETIALPGVTLLPGLIDMHTHITSSPLYGGYNYLEKSDAYWAVLSTKNARDTLNAGFTTIRNVGSDFYDDVGLREAIDDGVAVGPRIVTATYAIGATGGHCDSTFFPPSMEQQGPAVIDSPDEGRRMVRKLKKYGAQVIKICATGGVFSYGAEPGASS